MTRFYKAHDIGPIEYGGKSTICHRSTSSVGLPGDRQNNSKHLLDNVLRQAESVKMVGVAYRLLKTHYKREKERKCR